MTCCSLGNFFNTSNHMCEKYYSGTIWTEFIMHNSNSWIECVRHKFLLRQFSNIVPINQTSFYFQSRIYGELYTQSSEILDFLNNNRTKGEIWIKSFTCCRQLFKKFNRVFRYRFCLRSDMQRFARYRVLAYESEKKTQVTAIEWVYAQAIDCLPMIVSLVHFLVVNSIDSIKLVFYSYYIHWT